MATNGFYRPYTSDSDTDKSDSDSDTETQDTEDTEDTEDTSSTTSEEQEPAVPNFRNFAGNLLKPDIGGPDFDSSGTLLSFSNSKYGNPIGYEGPLILQNYLIQKDPSGEALDAANITLKTGGQDITSIIMLDSTDRDKNAYPQPTNLTLRLPRTYTNVTSFQVVQIKLLSSFVYFSLGKFNTDISILELGRVLADGAPNIIKTFIRPGTYSIDSLVSELLTELNATPLFYDFPNGFQDFAPRFAATGDFSIGFNSPGDNYYDSLLDQYIPDPTTDLIISKYFQSQYAGLSSYTTDQIKVAYYYPAVKEILLDSQYVNQLNLNIVTSVGALLPSETVRSRCIYTFEGLNDAVVQEIISLNLPLLDSYRVNHTFRYYLVNKYNVTYELQSNQVIISTDSLNTSLVNLLNYKQAQFFSEQLNAYKITQDDYNNYNTQNTLLLAVLNDMFYWLEKWLAVYYGINFNTYTIDYMATAQNLLPLRDAYSAVGISSNYDAAVVANNVVPQSNSILARYRNSAPQYWNRMSNLPESTTPFPLNLDTGDPATSSNYPYSVHLDEQDRSHPIVDANEYLYANQLTRYSDILVPLEASKYTIFRFKSPVRQTLQVETLPRPTKYRYPAYNAIAYDLSHQILFDASYAYVQNAQNAAMDLTSSFALQPIPGFSSLGSTDNFGSSYESSLQLWSGSPANLQGSSNRGFFTFQTPLPPGFGTAPGYRYPLSITLANATPTISTFNTPMQLFLYHDRGAFMADISDNRNEKNYHYLSTAVASTDVSSVTFTFPVYANQTYYALARSLSTIIPVVNYTVAPWFPDGSNYTTLSSSLAGFDPLADPTTPQALSNFNYAAVNDPAYIRLPVQSSIQAPIKVDLIYSTLTFSTVAIGYDRNGVSTDLTDYIGYAQSTITPGAITRMDPITGYSFQAITPYNQSTQAYFGAGSSNTILTPQGVKLYTPSTVAQRETSIVHWYGPNYIPNSINQAPILYNQITSSIQPFTTATTPAPLRGYTYGGSNSGIQLGDGVMGLSFIPQQGLWDIERMMFKSVYTTSNAATDGNLAIQYLGVFFASDAIVKYASDFHLTDAIAVLKFSKAVTYNGSNLNLGFDQTGGTYYEFLRDTTFRAGSNAYLYGYSQIRGVMNNDINSMYSFVPFDAGSNITTFQGLAGSLVPYPAYSDVSGVQLYLDGTPTPNGTDLIIPVTKAVPDLKRGPPAGYDQSQSKYEQSMPIGTTMLQYIQPYPFIQVSTSVATFTSFPFAPTKVISDVSGYLLAEDTSYRVYDWFSGASPSTLTERHQFTLDEVYPTHPDVNFLGVAANESEFAFFAWSNANLLVRTMDPATGLVAGTTYYSSLTGFDPASQQITNLTYNNYGGFTAGLRNGTTGAFTAYSKWTATGSNYTILSDLAPSGFNANVDSYITRQSPKEDAGAFYVFPHRTGLTGGVPTEGIVDYIHITPSNVIPGPNYNYTYQAITNGSTYSQIETFGLSNEFPPYVYRQPIVTRQPFLDQLFLLTETDPRHVYQVTNYQLSYKDQFTYDAYTTVSAYQFPIPISTMIQGGSGGKWFLEGDTLYGNTNSPADAPRKIGQSWQSFYPVQRIVFRQIAKNFTFMHNTAHLTYPEYPHTVLLGYNSLSSMQADISGQWGLESASNFQVADYSFSGILFDAYFFTFPLEKSTPANPYYYLAVRNYSPTEKSQVLLRTSLNNKYDFGYVSLSDISDEIILSATTSNQFTPEYYASLQGFNSNFVFGSNGHVFGANVVQGYSGSNFSNVTGFGDFYNQFVTLYNQYATQTQLVQNINNATTSNLNAFIQADLQYILPPSALTRQRYTDPLTFSILWKSSLYPQNAVKEEEWGLGWNLGYKKNDTTYETVHRADSFYKILDDYISLRMNPEYDMNRMDITAKENLSQTLEPRGTTKAFHAKLLLATFGSYAQTLISNPLSFAPSLGRIDKLTFQWTDSLGNILNNADCEWNAVLQFVERREVVTIQPPPLIDPTARSSEQLK